MKLIATKALRYGTRNLVADEIFDATENHGRVLIAIRKAKKAPAPKKMRVVSDELHSTVVPTLNLESPPEVIASDEKPKSRRQSHIANVPESSK